MNILLLLLCKVLMLATLMNKVSSMKIKISSPDKQLYHAMLLYPTKYLDLIKSSFSVNLPKQAVENSKVLKSTGEDLIVKYSTAFTRADNSAQLLEYLMFQAVIDPSGQTKELVMSICKRLGVPIEGKQEAWIRYLREHLASGGDRVTKKDSKRPISRIAQIVNKLDKAEQLTTSERSTLKHLLKGDDALLEDALNQLSSPEQKALLLTYSSNPSESKILKFLKTDALPTDLPEDKAKQRIQLIVEHLLDYLDDPFSFLLPPLITKSFLTYIIPHLSQNHPILYKSILVIGMILLLVGIGVVFVCCFNRAILEKKRRDEESQLVSFGSLNRVMSPIGPVRMHTIPRW